MVIAWLLQERWNIKLKILQCEKVFKFYCHILEKRQLMEKIRDAFFAKKCHMHKVVFEKKSTKGNKLDCFISQSLPSSTVTFNLKARILTQEQSNSLKLCRS